MISMTPFDRAKFQLGNS